MSISEPEQAEPVPGKRRMPIINFACDIVIDMLLSRNCAKIQERKVICV